MTLLDTIRLLDHPYVVWLRSGEADEVRTADPRLFRCDALTPLVACTCCDIGRVDPRYPLSDYEIDTALAGVGT